jgi:hypothetical protein
VAVHLLDVLDQFARFRTHDNALFGPIEQLDRQHGFQLADAAADRGMIELQPPRGRIDGPLAGDFEEDAQVVPVDRRQVHRIAAMLAGENGLPARSILGSL